MKKFLLLVTLVFAVGCGQENEAPANYEYEDVSDLEPPEPSQGSVEAEQEAQQRVAVMTVNEAVQGYRLMEGEYPDNLDKLVERGLLTSLPELPGDASYAYDPETGKVTLEE